MEPLQFQSTVKIVMVTQSIPGLVGLIGLISPRLDWLLIRWFQGSNFRNSSGIKEIQLKSKTILHRYRTIGNGTKHLQGDTNKDLLDNSYGYNSENTVIPQIVADLK